MFVVLCLGCGPKPKPEPTPPPAQQESDSEAAGSDSGDCSKERCLAAISRLVTERKSATRACYDKAIKKQPTIGEGRVIINFKIDPDGTVIETSQGMQDDQITDDGVVNCISDVIKGIKFPKSPSGKTTRAYHLFEFTRR